MDTKDVLINRSNTIIKEKEYFANDGQRLGSLIKDVIEYADGISQGQISLGKVANLTILATPNTSTNERVNPIKGDRWIVSDQINPENNLPYYFVYKGNGTGETGNVAANWNNTGETIIGADAATKTDLTVKTSRSEIFNVSQYNNKYDYTDSATARNAVPTNLRGLTQQLIYKLASGELITESYQGTSLQDWANNDNWENLISSTVLSFTSNVEFIGAWVDEKQRVLLGLNREDGSLQNPTIDKLKNQLNLNADEVTTIKSNVETVSGDVENIKEVSSTLVTDPEGRISVETDVSGKILSYRDSSGVKAELLGFVTPKLEAENIQSPVIDELSDNITDLQDITPDKIQADEFLWVLTDSKGNVLFGKRPDGSTYDSDYEERFKDITKRLTELEEKFNMASTLVLSDTEYKLSKDANIYYLDADALLKGLPIDIAPQYLMFVGGDVNLLTLYGKAIKLGDKIKVEDVNNILLNQSYALTASFEYWVIDTNNNNYR